MFITSKLFSFTRLTRQAYPALVVLLATLLIIMISACGGGRATKADTEPVITDAPLSKRYSTILVQKAETDKKTETDYPTAASEYTNGLLTELRTKNYQANMAGATDIGRNTQNSLTIKTKVVSLLVVTGSQRFWFGAMAGKSDMIVEIKLIDDKTGNVVREKVLSTGNNPFAATIVGGSSDKSLPSDMGKIAASYITAIMPR